MAQNNAGGAADEAESAERVTTQHPWANVKKDILTEKKGNGKGKQKGKNKKDNQCPMVA